MKPSTSPAAHAGEILVTEHVQAMSAPTVPGRFTPSRPAPARGSRAMGPSCPSTGAPPPRIDVLPLVDALLESDTLRRSPHQRTDLDDSCRWPVRARQTVLVTGDPGSARRRWWHRSPDSSTPMVAPSCTAVPRDRRHPSSPSRGTGPTTSITRRRKHYTNHVPVRRRPGAAGPRPSSAVPGHTTSTNSDPEQRFSRFSGRRRLVTRHPDVTPSCPSGTALGRRRNARLHVTGSPVTSINRPSWCGTYRSTELTPTPSGPCCGAVREPGQPDRPRRPLRAEVAELCPLDDRRGPG